MAYDVLDIARYIINYGNKKEYNISNLKLQKILYFVQASFLVDKNMQPCFNEDIEAWDFGPVVPKVYREFKMYGSNNIPYIDSYIDLSNGIWEATKKLYNEDIIFPEDKNLINSMVDECSQYSAGQLVEITHNQDPWKNVYFSGWNKIITKDSIYNFFSEG
ncbi:type II toxin-antitoxin system antitoxin SocA domain-containing protein [Clostridium sp. BJN0001]|uniref:Panacea domain-containing protein n=1 Tax=Clostridium sp. BJN0001 TaxID=2930219 RepID=UPI001FD10256|nr:type II toxin-antitoxin system antitoxin SocA domain-containing protein [Clostridium sp. BJN0001]